MESLASIACLLDDLASVVSLCSEHRVSLAKKQSWNLKPYNH